jgi:hypothetical protein
MVEFPLVQLFQKPTYNTQGFVYLETFGETYYLGGLQSFAGFHFISRGKRVEGGYYGSITAYRIHSYRTRTGSASCQVSRAPCASQESNVFLPLLAVRLTPLGRQKEYAFFREAQSLTVRFQDWQAGFSDDDRIPFG